MSNHPDKTTQARRLLKPHQVQQERLSSYMFLLKMYREGWQQAAPYLSRAYGALALFAGLGAGIAYFTRSKSSSPSTSDEQKLNSN